MPGPNKRVGRHVRFVSNGVRLLAKAQVGQLSFEAALILRWLESIVSELRDLSSI